MLWFRKKQRFIREDGSFDNTRFRELLEMSKKAALRKKPPSFASKKARAPIVL